VLTVALLLTLTMRGTWQRGAATRGYVLLSLQACLWRSTLEELMFRGYLLPRLSMWLGGGYTLAALTLTFGLSPWVRRPDGGQNGRHHGRVRAQVRGLRNARAPVEISAELFAPEVAEKAARRSAIIPSISLRALGALRELGGEDPPDQIAQNRPQDCTAIHRFSVAYATSKCR
jgi:hypothetical protein